MAYWDFLQMTPENQAAARNMSWGQAIKSEIPGTSNYRGYSPFYKGADATSLGGYLKQGGQSLAGNFQGGSNVGGATPLMRKLAMSPVTRGIGTLGRFAGLTNPVGAAAMSAYAAPKLINALTERDPDATETSMFGLNISDLEKKAMAFEAGAIEADGTKAMPGATLNDWGFPSGPVPGEEIGKDDVNKNETWTLPQRDWGPVRHTEPRPRRNKFDLFLQKFGASPMTQVTAADKRANKQFMGQQGIGVDEQTGRMTTGDFAGKIAPGKSAYGSANFGEMAQKWDEEYGDMVYKTQKMRDKQARIKQQAAAYAQKLEADRQERIRNERAKASAITARRDPTGGGASAMHMGNISQANAQAVAKANAAMGMSGWGLAQGGRVGYNEGGRVGILSVF
jgi:hypothetical protein